MTSLEYTNHDIKVFQSQIIDIIKEIRDLRNEVQSLQKSVALVLNRLPHIVHDGLINHECKCKGFE
jgi:hypothetical protein